MTRTHARAHTHTQLFSYKFVTEFADVSPFGVFPASTPDVLRFTYCRPAADPTAACEQALVWSGHDTAESGRDQVIVCGGNGVRSLSLCSVINPLSPLVFTRVETGVSFS